MNMPQGPFPFPCTIVLAQEDGAGALPSAPTTAREGASGQGTTQADGSGGGANGGGQQAPPQSPFGGQFMLLLLGLFAFMIIMSMMSARKEKKRRAQMLSTLGKHDRVMMSGGLIGTLMEVKGDEVVVRVDESTNTRITFSKASVQSVLKSAGEPAAAEV